MLGKVETISRGEGKGDGTMTAESREKMLDAQERASLLLLQVQNDRHWPARHVFIALLREYVRRIEGRLAA